MTTSIKFIEKLRKSGLRPTKQRIKICEVLFISEKTFHFTVNDLLKMVEKNTNDKISLATVYNTVHAFKKKGYLKEIAINSSKSYFDTNTTSHHHFYNEEKNELIDISDREIEPIKINKKILGKRIKSVEVLVKIESEN
tara:strand:+ start:2120 stop:2536 length:417 start_codon:yes stop_codon:yes gene_type:complete